MCEATAAPLPSLAPKLAGSAQHVAVRLSVICEATNTGQRVELTLVTTSKPVTEQPWLRWTNKLKATVIQLPFPFQKGCGAASPATTSTTHAADSAQPSSVSCSSHPDRISNVRAIVTRLLFARRGAGADHASKHEATLAASSTPGSSAHPAQPAAEPVVCTVPASAQPPWTSRLRARVFRILFAQEAARIEMLEGQLAAESHDKQQLNKSLGERDSRIPQLQTALTQCIQQRQQLRESLHTADTSIGLMHSNLRQAERNVETLRSQLVEAQLAAQHTHSALERLDNAETALAGAQQAVQQLQEEVRTLEGREKTHISPAAQEGLMKLAGKIKEQKAELASVTLEVVQLRAELASMKTRFPIHRANVSL